jgi:hypothetical protein
MFARRNLTSLAAVLILLCFVPRVPCMEADGAGIVDDVDAPLVEESVADSEEKEPAFLIARKHVIEDTVVQGRNMTIAVTVYNVGKGYDSPDSELSQTPLVITHQLE